VKLSVDRRPVGRYARLVGVLGAVGGLVLATGLGVDALAGNGGEPPTHYQSSAAPHHPNASTTPTRRTPPPAATSLPGARAKTGAPQRTPLPPEQLDIPSLDVRAKVVPLTLDPMRTLVPPSDPRLVGWWADSAPAGASRGTTVITGHRVHTGGGALNGVPRLRPDHRVTLQTADGPVSYRVSRIIVLGKAQLARDADRVFDDTGPARLVLITCGDWDGEVFRSNVLVFATPMAATSLP
jgi:hypothetical protein